MELRLFRKTTIGEVKREFAKNFRYLKLEFFAHPHKSFRGSPMQQRLNDSLTLAEIKTVRREGALSFQPSMTVTDFESLLQKEFGLPVQVFRKSGDLWLETIQTDNLPLEKQNKMGEAASKPMHINLATLFL